MRTIASPQARPPSSRRPIRYQVKQERHRHRPDHQAERPEGQDSPHHREEEQAAVHFGAPAGQPRLEQVVDGAGEEEGPPGEEQPRDPAPGEGRKTATGTPTSDVPTEG